MMLSRGRILTTCSRMMQQQRRKSTNMDLIFAGANQMYYYKADVHQIDVPTFSGSFGILASHVPTLAVLRPGVVKVIEKDFLEKFFFVSSGSVCVLANGSVQVLAEEAVPMTDLDRKECKRLYKRYKKEANRAVADLDYFKAKIAYTCAKTMYTALKEFHLEEIAAEKAAQAMGK